MSEYVMNDCMEELYVQQESGKSVSYRYELTDEQITEIRCYFRERNYDVEKAIRFVFGLGVNAGYKSALDNIGRYIVETREENTV